MSNNNQETGAPNAPAFDSPQGNSPQNPSVKAHEQSADSWPLEADRVAIHDPLVDALRILGALLVLAGVVLVVAPWRASTMAAGKSATADPANPR